MLDASSCWARDLKTGLTQGDLEVGPTSLRVAWRCGVVRHVVTVGIVEVGVTLGVVSHGPALSRRPGSPVLISRFIVHLRLRDVKNYWRMCHARRVPAILPAPISAQGPDAPPCGQTSERLEEVLVQLVEHCGALHIQSKEYETHGQARCSVPCGRSVEQIGDPSALSLRLCTSPLVKRLVEAAPQDDRLQTCATVIRCDLGIQPSPRAN